jgi:hypothetical protein
MPGAVVCGIVARATFLEELQVLTFSAGRLCARRTLCIWLFVGSCMLPLLCCGERSVFNDEWLYTSYNKVFRIRVQPGAVPEVLWAHPEAPMVSSSLICHNPCKPVFQVRQNPAVLRKRPHRWSSKYPARMLVTDEGEALGPALASIEQGHGAWLGNGEFLSRGFLPRTPCRGYRVH